MNLKLLLQLFIHSLPLRERPCSVARITLFASSMLALFAVLHCILVLQHYQYASLVLSADTFNISGMYAGDHGCDRSRGRWVRSEEQPLYTNKTCKLIQPNQDCIGNGRPDTGYTRWRWQPLDCELPRFDPITFLSLLRNQKMLFVGDSISRNHMQSLLCSLSQVEEPENVFYDGRDKVYIWRFPSYNFTLGNSWSPFLVNHTLDNSSGIYKIHLDMPDVLWTSVLPNYDIAIFSTAYWYFRPSIYYAKKEILGANEIARQNLTTVRILPRIKHAWETVLKHIVDEYNGIAIVRTVTVPHFEDGQWDEGGFCNRTEPVSDPELQMALPWTSSEMYRSQKEEFAEALEGKRRRGAASRLELMDVTYSSLLRPDGHPGPYRIQMLPEPRNDCLHWCLPGPIDMWNQLLMEILRPYYRLHEPL